MLENYRAMATLPAQDLDRARRFYEEKLGLKPSEERPDGLTYECGGAPAFLLFPSHGQPSGAHTQFSWEVDDIENLVSQLRANGVVFEEYDLPGLKTENGIAEIAGEKGAWFKDSEGNLLAIGEMTSS